MEVCKQMSTLVTLGRKWGSCRWSNFFMIAFFSSFSLFTASYWLSAVYNLVYCSLNQWAKHRSIFLSVHFSHCSPVQAPNKCGHGCFLTHKTLPNIVWDKAHPLMPTGLNGWLFFEHVPCSSIRFGSVAKVDTLSSPVCVKRIPHECQDPGFRSRIWRSVLIVDVICLFVVVGLWGYNNPTKLNISF